MVKDDDQRQSGGDIIFEINSSAQDKWQSSGSWAAERQRNRRRRQETEPPVEVREHIMGHSKATMVRSFALKSEIEKELKIIPDINDHFYQCF